MKLLMFYARDWWYRTAEKSLPDVPDVEMEESVRDAVVIFFHAEAEDEERRKSVLQKFLKNLHSITKCNT